MTDFDYADMENDFADPYDRMPFGDAIRWEDEQVARDLDAGEGQPDYSDDPDDIDAYIASRDGESPAVLAEEAAAMLPFHPITADGDGSFFSEDELELDCQ